MSDYLQHSSKGTSWKKQQHDYDKKINKRYYYSYEKMLKKLWKLKQSNDPRYQELKTQYDAEKKRRGNAKVAKIYNKTAEKTNSPEIRKQAEEFQRRANDAKPKRSNNTNIASDILNKSLRDVKVSIKKGKKLLERYLNKGN